MKVCVHVRDYKETVVCIACVKRSFMIRVSIGMFVSCRYWSFLRKNYQNEAYGMYQRRAHQNCTKIIKSVRITLQCRVQNSNAPWNNVYFQNHI
jgi:hypothetical protein